MKQNMDISVVFLVAIRFSSFISPLMRIAIFVICIDIIAHTIGAELHVHAAHQRKLN